MLNRGVGPIKRSGSGNPGWRGSMSVAGSATLEPAFSSIVIVALAWMR
ncbi:hypothetical protein [endosymbiont of Lamellibrachia barhami]|nr:hypothetical protein [endosymbiont of Lamellibrachia barhami]